MSANRSVQAAQRRRAGPTSEPPIPGRGPQPSINSAQMFANQAKPGSGPNIPTGRLAGQQAALQQQPQMNSKSAQQNTNKLSSVTKMTIPQAITLITLRLGVLESKMMNSNFSQEGNFNLESSMDTEFLQSIISRLDALENQQTNTGTSISNSEFNLVKQQFEQFETVKQAVVQLKTATIPIIKENTTLKTQVENLKKELLEVKELVVVLQNLTMDNSQKILDISMNNNLENTNEINFANIESFEEILSDLKEIPDDGEQNEIIGNNLKQIIESELNIDM